ncbi:H1_5 [Mytilus coruscus]|uniref:H1_5 n=1 Tax=Mytilus coruscus TaxID=42192 RepID=A0A6J8C846_MYTCO|nr:H1_5 [Mytilus coruscus]
MSDAPVVVKTQLSHQRRKLQSKPKKVAKPKSHPKYSEMRCKTVNTHLKLALKSGVKSNSLKQSKGTGASGSFKIGEVAKPAKKPAKKAVKPKAAKPKKAKTPKKTATKKPAAKKPAGEKKAAKPKAKKPATKKPAAKSAKKATKSPKKTKAAAKPKKAKTPKKNSSQDPAKSPKKKAAAKPKKVATHPKYSEMRCKNSQHSLEVSFEIRSEEQCLKQSKGTGASGSFKIGEVAKPAKKPAKKAVET